MKARSRQKVDLAVNASEKAREQVKVWLLEDCDDFVEHATPEEIRFLHEVLVQWRLDKPVSDLPIADACNIVGGNLSTYWLKVSTEHYREVKQFAAAMGRGDLTAPVGAGWHVWKNPRQASEVAN